MSKVKPVTKKVIEARAKREAKKKGSMSTGICLFAMEGGDDGGMSGGRLEDAARQGDRKASKEFKKREKDKTILFEADFQAAEPEDEIPDKNWDPPFNE